MFKHLIQLSQPQIRKMQNHQTIQIKQADLMKGNITIYVDEKINKKILTAHRNGKGIRLNPTDYSINPPAMNGAGIGKIKRYAKNAVKGIMSAALLSKAVPYIKNLPNLPNEIKDGYAQYNHYFNSPYTQF